MTQAFHRQRPLVLVACAWGLGIWVGAAGGPDVRVLWAGVVVGAALTALLWRTHTPVWGACAVAFFLAALYVLPAAHPSLPPVGKYMITARVNGIAEQRPEDGRIQTLLEQVTLTDDAGIQTRVASAYWTYFPEEGAPLPPDGQGVQFSGSVYHPAPQENPYGFDFRQYLLTKGVPIGISNVRELSFVPALQTEDADFWLRLRVALGDRIDGVLGDAAPVAKALLIGDRTDLSDETTTVFRDGGVAHVLAVSGLHVGLLMAGILYVLRRMHASPAVQLALVSVILLAYCRLLNFSAPVVRAAILTEVLLLGRLLRKSSDPLTTLAFAFVLVLLLRPMDLFSLGFQLSFLAVLGIGLLGDRILYALQHLRARRMMWRTAQAYAVTVSATAFVAPPSIAAFHRFSLVGLLVGPIACAAVGLLMYGYIAVLVLSYLWLPLAQTLAVPVVLGTKWFLSLMSHAASAPWVVLTLPAPPFVWVVAYYLVMVLLTRYVRMRSLPRLAVGTLAVAASVAVTLALVDSSARYTQFSQGASDAAVIEDGEHTYVIDAGEHGGDLASYLLSRGRTVDTLYITHLHKDHLGGLVQLMEQRVPVREIAVPAAAEEASDIDWGIAMLGAARDAGIPVRVLHHGDTMVKSRVSMEVLWPPEDAYPGQAPNRASLVTWWDIAGLSVLAMGDLVGDYEQYALKPAQVLKVSHHGAKDSTRQPMVDIVQPQLAIITTSDTYRQRAQAVTERLTASGSQVLFTDTSGAIQLSVAPDGVSIYHHLVGEAF